jgi:hypothetical protein
MRNKRIFIEEQSRWDVLVKVETVSKNPKTTTNE